MMKICNTLSLRLMSKWDALSSIRWLGSYARIFVGNELSEKITFEKFRIKCNERSWRAQYITAPHTTLICGSTVSNSEAGLFCASQAEKYGTSHKLMHQMHSPVKNINISFFHLFPHEIKLDIYVLIFTIPKVCCLL